MFMKKVIGVIAFLFIGIFVTSTMSLAQTVNENEINNDLEIVFLLDVSGSLDMADPEIDGSRVCTEAVEYFVEACQTGRNLYVRIVPFNDNIYKDFETVNVSTDDGLNEFYGYIEDILKDKGPSNRDSSSVLKGISCWAPDGNTNIGAAIRFADEYFSKSTLEVGKRAVVLFTDGNTEVYDNNSVFTRESLAEEYELPEEMIEQIEAKEYIGNLETVDSYLKAIKYCEALKNRDVNIYSLAFEGGSRGIDREFLKMISVNWIEGYQPIVKHNSDVYSLFDELNRHFDLIGIGIKDKIGDGVPIIKTYRVYDKATKSMTISVNSSSKLYSVSVTSPDGQHRSMTLHQSGIFDKDLFKINIRPSIKGISLVIDEPKGGEWTVEVNGAAGTAYSSSAIYYDLSVDAKHSATDELYVEDEFTVEAYFKNAEKNVVITDSYLYIDHKDNRGLLIVNDESDNHVETIKGKLSNEENSYTFNYSFENPGEYHLDVQLYNPLVIAEGNSLNSELDVKVVGPVLQLSNETEAGSKAVNYTLSLKHPITEETLTKIPAYAQKSFVIVEFYDEYGEIAGDTLKIKASELKDGSYEFRKEYDKPGNYYAVATLEIEGYEDIVAKSSNYKIEPKPITTIAESITVTHPVIFSLSALKRVFEAEVDITDVFENHAEGDIIYSVESYLTDDSAEAVKPDESLLSGEITDKDGRKILKITCKNFGNEKIRVNALNFDGMSSYYDIAVEHKSGIAFWIVIAVILIGAIICVGIIVVMKRPREIRGRYTVKISKNSGGSIKYEIDTGSRKVGKSISLRRFITNPDIIISKQGSLDNDVMELVYSFADKIKVVGKDNGIIKITSRKTKKQFVDKNIPYVPAFINTDDGIVFCINAN